MNREEVRNEYLSIIDKMTDDIYLTMPQLSEIVDICMDVDRLVKLGNDYSPNHCLQSTQVIAWIVYDYLRKLNGTN